MSKVRVGIVGTGGMAQGHIARLHTIPDVEITALCDIRPAALERTLERHPHLKGVACFDDFGKMLMAGSLDAVEIVTP
ncbi:MAG TPA: Gfo/Idh/MocA family oxidoreductase, partial [Chthonomonadales bacterium]|nr:Gfo/Idh/MocA family oxidoreductase [Chthonomonadales bacterium]